MKYSVKNFLYSIIILLSLSLTSCTGAAAETEKMAECQNKVMKIEQPIEDLLPTSSPTNENEIGRASCRERV